MTNRPRNIGTSAETAVVRTLRANGFPGADRSPLRGNHDQGDITGCPGIAWEVKGGEKARQAEAANVTLWLKQAEIERGHARADLGILVIARRGYGAPRADRWWAVLPARNLADLMYGITPDTLPSPAVWLELGHLLPILRDAGYGTPDTPALLDHRPLTLGGAL